MHLSLNQLALSVNLGWTERERAIPQTVILDVTLQFNAPPLGCHTDQLHDTICYDELILALRAALQAQSFHLLEYLAQFIFDWISAYCGNQAKVLLTLTKFPPIPGLEGGVSIKLGKVT